MLTLAELWHTISIGVEVTHDCLNVKLGEGEDLGELTILQVSVAEDNLLIFINHVSGLIN